MQALSWSAAVLILGLVLGCSRGRDGIESGCPYRSEGVTSLLVREAPLPAAGDPQVQEPSLVVRVRHGGPTGPALEHAEVGLYRDTTVELVGERFQSTMTDSAGFARLRAVPEGRYGFLVRRIGYEILREVVEVRSNFADTVEVTLATSVLCLSRVVPAAT